MSVPQIAVELEELARRIRRMRGIGRNGHASHFYEDRSEAARDAELLADWQRTGRRPAEFVLASDRPRGGERRDSFRQR